MDAAMGKKQALVLGTVDTKGEEVEYLARSLAGKGVEVEIVDTTPAQWLKPGDATTSRSQVMEIAAAGSPKRSWPGSRRGRRREASPSAAPPGPRSASPALQRLPLGFPKVLISPVVSGETTPYIDTSDIVMVPPVVDFAGSSTPTPSGRWRLPQRPSLLDAASDGVSGCQGIHLAVTAFGVTTPLVEMIGRESERDGRKAGRLLLQRYRRKGVRAFYRRGQGVRRL